MADILIRGVAVPDRCDYRCPFYVSKGFQACGLTGKSYNWGLDKRPSDCPIHELPEHGDLIDRDAFREENEYYLNREFINPKYEDTLDDLLKDAPVVIPSNKEKTE